MAREAAAEIRRLAVEFSVYRGHVLEFGSEMLGPHQSALSFHERPAMEREELILPPGMLEGIEAQILGVNRHRATLLAHGQHLKRGVLLFGPPGTGKTHTVRYLMSRLPETTVVVLTADALRLIGHACEIARALQPALVVVEDVDLIAQDRSHMHATPLLFQLLNEMDGLDGDADVTFLLTTNRVDALEPALAMRPGRVDHAVEVPLPDAEGRRTPTGALPRQPGPGPQRRRLTDRAHGRRHGLLHQGTDTPRHPDLADRTATTDQNRPTRTCESPPSTSTPPWNSSPARSTS